MQRIKNHALVNIYMRKNLPSEDALIEELPEDALELASEEEEVQEREYSKEDLVDLIDVPEWKTILIDLVKREKMNPWDIDVAELEEKYLKKINELEHSSLRVPANAILACAILLKTKSKYLRLSSLDDEEEEPLSAEQKEMFLEEIPDLMANRSFREGKISLDELVASIEDIIDATKPRKAKVRDIPRMELNFDDFSIEDKLDDVEALIQDRVDSQGIVMFNSLLENNETTTLVEMFLAVIFLMNKGKLFAYQTEFFGDIFIQLLKEGSGDNTIVQDSA